MGIIDDLLGQGIEWVDDVADEIKDLADEEPGLTVFRAIATSVSGGLGPILGPQLASVAFALPGLLRGERFDEAWWNEFCWRVEKTAEILARDLLNDYVAQFKSAGAQLVSKASGAFPNIPLEDAVKRLAPDIKQIARELGIREDMTAYAVSLARRLPFPPLDAYDLEKGVRKPLSSVSQACQRLGVGGSQSLRAVISGATEGGSVLKWIRAVP